MIAGDSNSECTMPANVIGWWHTITWRRVAAIFGETLAWAWTIGLILTEGPLPLTHGWYAMFSGLAWCPATAWLLKRYVHVEASYWTRFTLAALLILAGRLALIVKI
jgi:hypothetical protein